MISCTRRVVFDAAHRLINHESNCKYLHGHRYICEATFQAPALDVLGRVIDFGIIKTILGQWIDQNLDHNTILSKEDVKLAQAIEENTKRQVYFLDSTPTAENIALHILETCHTLFKHHEVSCVKIRLYETENCYAEVTAS